MAEYVIKVDITSDSDTAAVQQFAQALQGVKAQHEEVTKATEEHGGVIDSLKHKIIEITLEYLSWREAIGFVVESFKAAVASEKAVTELTAVAQRFGGVTKENLPILKEWVERFELIAAISKEEMIPSLNRLTIALHDTEKAQRIVETAAGMAARGLGSFQENVSTMTRVLNTGVVPMRNMSALASLLRQGGDDLSGTINKLHDEFGDMGAAVHTTAMELQRNKQAWDETHEAIGKVELSIASKIRPAFVALSTVIATVAAGWYILTGVVKSATMELGDWGEAALKLLSGDFQGAVDAATKHGKEREKILQEYVDRAQQMRDEVKAIWADLDKSEAEREGGKNLDKGDIKNKKEAKEAAALAKARQEAENKAVEFRKSLEDAEYDRREKAEKAYLDRMAKIEEKSTAEQMKRYEDSQNAQIAYRNQSIGKLYKLDTDLHNKEKHLGVEELRTVIKNLKDAYDAGVFYGNMELVAREVITQAEAKLDQMLAATKREQFIKNTDETIGALGTLFGATKEAGIATALINVIGAAIGAFDETHGDIYTRLAALAAALAAGYAQVTQMESISIGSGGGRSPSMGSGYGAGSIVGAHGAYTPPPPNNTYHYGGATHVTVNALTGTQAASAMRELEKARLVGARSYGRSVAGSSQASIGTARKG